MKTVPGLMKTDLYWEDIPGKETVKETKWADYWSNENGSVILYAQWKKDVSVHAYSGGVSTGSIRRVSQKSNLYANGWVYNNVDYTGGAGSECGAASSSMAVSYLGVDISPGEICYRSGNGKIPFETAWIFWSGITPRLNFDGSQFGNYFNDYENDASYKYSPVIIHLTVYPGSNNHFVVVIGKIRMEPIKYVIQ